MVYTHWQHITIMYYAMYYIIYLHEDIHVLCNIFIWRYNVSWNVCVYVEICGIDISRLTLAMFSSDLCFFCFFCFFSMVLHGCPVGSLLCLLFLLFSRGRPTYGFSCTLPQKQQMGAPTCILLNIFFSLFSFFSMVLRGWHMRSLLCLLFLLFASRDKLV